MLLNHVSTTWKGPLFEKPQAFSVCIDPKFIVRWNKINLVIQQISHDLVAEHSAPVYILFVAATEGISAFNVALVENLCK